MRNLPFFLCFAFLTVLFYSCGPEGHPKDWQEMDLMRHGIPLTILAPDSADVKTLQGTTLMQDVSVRKGDDFYIQIFASPAQTTDIARLKADRLAEVRDNPYFQRIVEETDDGFLFESKIDEKSNFGFRRIKVKGDREFVFQNGLSGLFTEEDARMMFEAVK